MTTSRICVAVVLFGLVSPLVVSATDIRTAVQEDSAPKFIVEDGKPIGLCVDIMHAIEQRDPTLKFTYDPHPRPLKRIEAETQSGDQDALCGLIRNKDREANYQTIVPRLFPVEYRLVVRKDDTVTVQNWDDVRKLGTEGLILVNAGSGPTKRLDEIGGLQVDSGGRTADQNFKKLLSGRGRFYYYRTPGLSAEIKKAGVAGQVKLLPKVMEAQDFFLMVGKHVPHDTVERLSAAVKALQDDGELAKLLDKWDEY